MSPKFNHGVYNDMCAIPEESGMDLLSIPANECAAQLTAMDAVSVNLFLGSNLKGWLGKSWIYEKDTATKNLILYLTNKEA